MRATANDRLKRGWGRRFWGSLWCAAALHVAVFQLWPTMAVAEAPEKEPPIQLSPIEEAPLPEQPEPPQRPARPIITDIGVDEAPEFIRTDWETYEEMGPPPPEQEQTVVATGPAFTPMEVAPRLLNDREVSRALESEYPSILRDTGIGGQVVVWFYIDEAGQVQDTRIAQGSEHEAFDTAALRIANLMRFAPALNREQPVAVWVSIPITFTVR